MLWLSKIGEAQECGSALCNQNYKKGESGTEVDNVRASKE